MPQITATVKDESVTIETRMSPEVYRAVYFLAVTEEKKILAIKLFRRIYKIGLRESKYVVDSIIANGVHPDDPRLDTTDYPHFVPVNVTPPQDMKLSDVARYMLD